MAFDISSAAITLAWRKMFFAYQEVNVFRPEMADYLTVALGETYNLNTIPKRDAQFLDDATTLTEDTDPLGNVAMTLFDPLKDWTDLKRSDVQVRPDLSLVSNKFVGMGRNISNTETRALLSILCKAAAAGPDNEETFDALTTAGLGDRIVTQLEIAAAKLDARGVPPQNRWGMMKSRQWYALKSIAGVTSSDFGGMANNQFPIKVLNFLNFQICNVGTFWGQALNAGFPTDAQYDAADAIGMFWHADAWAWRRVRSMEQIGPREIRPNDTFNIESRIHWTAKTRDVEGLELLSDDGV